MRSLILQPIDLFSIALLLLGCAFVPPRSAAAEQAAAKSDPITTLVEKISASRGLWLNGSYPILGLPASASADEVLARMFEMTSFAEGRVKQYRILETRLVQISGSPPNTCIAALVRTELGDKIVLLRYEGTPMGWWSRVYDPGSAG
jgi:hypothetical protein